MNAACKQVWELFFDRNKQTARYFFSPKKKKGLTKDYERIAVWGLQTMVSHLQIPHKNEEENSCIEGKRNLGELE